MCEGEERSDEKKALLLQRGGMMSYVAFAVTSL